MSCVFISNLLAIYLHSATIIIYIAPLQDHYNATPSKSMCMHMHVYNYGGARWSSSCVLDCERSEVQIKARTEIWIEVSVP